MGIGVSVFLFAVGAILAFAVDATVSGLDIATVGVILMIAGALGLIMTLAVFAPRRGRRQTVVDEYDDGVGGRRVTRDDVI
jgi:membrane protein implicated in regulation of membrane protease activity